MSVAVSRRPVLRLIRERKIGDLIGAPGQGAVLEASGVFARGREYFVVFDNIRRVALITAKLAPGPNKWLGRSKQAEGYEDIAYSRKQRRFYLLIEAEKHPDGTYKAVIEEYDEAWRRKARRWVDFRFKSRNNGFEGLSVVPWRGVEYLLALCEGNNCLPGRKGKKPGKGRIHVLQRKGQLWKTRAVIKLPPQLDFEDYSALAVRGDRIAVVSQRSSRLWLGKLRRSDWTIRGIGRAYEFPRTKKGKRLYCTVEGVAWLSPTTFVMVSDLRKGGYPDRCARTDQSIHIFSLR